MATAPTLTPAEERLLVSLPIGDVRDALRNGGLPTRRVEAWKWSDLRAALKDARDPSGRYDYTSADDEPLLAELGGTEIVLANGSLRAPAGLPAAVRVQKGEPQARIYADAPLASLASVAPVLTVGIEQSLDAPLFIRRLSDGAGAHADRMKIVVAPGAEVTLVETHRFTGSPFANGLTELVIGHGAKVTRVILHPDAGEAVSVQTSLVDVSDGATYHQMTLSGGAALSRLETRLAYAGPAETRLDGLYRLTGTAHCDLTSHVTHDVPDAMTRQLVKGIVDDRGHAVFQGKFHVGREGQHTDAQMGHHALLMSGNGTVNAKPELEIYADDVECAHGNTVGALDAEALFYLRQRGLDEAAAQAMLTGAFAAEVLDEIEDEALRDVLATFFEKGLTA